MLVGSSSNNKSGFVNKALASASLILQPPENSFVVIFCISVVNPRPSRIIDALQKKNASKSIENS